MFDLSLESVDDLHRSRWPELKSALGYWVGYNVVIFKDGKYSQTRLIGEETAAQKGHNFDTVSFCLAGNFSPLSPDRPTFEQRTTLKRLISGLLDKKTELKVLSNTVLDCSPLRIHPHRVLQPNHTECYGLALPDSWGRDLVSDRLTYPQVAQKTLSELLQEVLKLFQSRKLGSSPQHCLEANNRG